MPDAIVLTGATGVGKTALSLELAEALGAEIISIDSRLVYRGLDIGTDKPVPEQLARVRHHLIDVTEPGSRFTVSDYMEKAAAAATEITSRGKIPLFVGGTCMYIAAMLDGFAFGGLDRDEGIRKTLEARAAEEGAASMHRQLREIDPAAAARIHPNDFRRVMRALEVFMVTGETLTRRNARAKSQGPSPAGGLSIRVFGVCRPRKNLFDNISKRVISLYNRGLVDETSRALEQHPGTEHFLNLIIGYAQALKLISGEVSEPEARDLTAKATREFAKRQLTWFRRMTGVTWLNLETISPSRGVEIISSASNILIN